MTPGKKTLASLFILLVTAVFSPLAVKAQTYTFETWNNANTPVMTVAGFQSVAVDKRGKVWAGSTLGGLYCYRDNQWAKINIYPDISFRQIIPSNLPLDSNVWASSIGKSGSQAVSGGAYHINTLAETATQYGLAGGLSSNYVNSLAYSSQGQVYVALQQSVSGTTVRQGGVYKSSTLNPTPLPASTFSKAIPDVGDVTYFSAANRGDELWFGRGANCVGGCKAPYISRVSASGVAMSPITSQNSPLPFTNAASSAYARAIYTDTISGSTFVGLNSGGVGVYKSDETWKLFTSSNSVFPVGASVYFNAITEVYGEVWIGTSAGIFVYDGRGAVDDSTSYKLLTTTNGLPNNFVTDIAVDTARGQIWITTSTGISRCDYVPPSISGYVFDAGIVVKPPNFSTAPVLSSNFVRYEAAGVIVRLYEGEKIIEAITPSETGFFEFTKAEDGKYYKVEYEYLIDPKLKYEVNDAKNHRPLPVVFFPIKLVSELRAYKPYLKERIFKLPISYVVNPGFKWNGFDVSEYDLVFQNIDAANQLQLKLDRITNNLANFYSSAVTVYTLGGNSTELIQKSISYALELMDAMLDFVTIATKTKKTYGQLLNDQLAVQYQRQLDNLVMILRRVTQAVPASREVIEKMLGIIEEAKFLKGVLAFDGGSTDDKMSFVKDQLKKAVAFIGGGTYYRDVYCGYTHKDFIWEGASAANIAKSSNLYNKVVSNHYSSHIFPSQQILTATNTQMDQLEEYAGMAKYVSETSDLFAKITLLTPGAWLAPWFKAAATAANGLRVAFLTGAMIEGYRGGVDIAELSKSALNVAGLKTSIKINLPPGTNPPPANISLTALQTAKQLYQQRITELQIYFDVNVYDSLAFFPKLKNLGKADSTFNKELKIVLNSFDASSDSAQTLIPSYTSRYGFLIDSFVAKGNFMREGFFYNNLAYIYDSVKTGYHTDFKRLSDSIILLNDSVMVGLQRLKDSLLTYNIKTSAHLVQTDFAFNHSFYTNQPGNFIYTFTNFGGVALPNLSFKLKNITGGYTLTSPDSLTKGDVQPAQSITAQFSYTSPALDSIGYYNLVLYSNGQVYTEIPGALFAIDPSKFYTIKNGNWSDPTIWLNGMVPNATSTVEINHNIMVDIDASCKVLRNLYPAQLSVLPGKKLTIVK